MQGVHLRKYGVQATIDFELYEVDGVDLRVDAADGGTDCTVMKDEGVEATATNDFVDEGKGYSLVLTATEMQAARVVLYIVDSVTKVYLDKGIVIETYGHPSAMHPDAFSASACSGTIAVQTADTVFNLTATLGTLSSQDDTYNNMIICIFDNSGSVYETARITDYVGGSTRITIDHELTFPVENGVDTWVIYRDDFSDVGAATITDADKNDIVDRLLDEETKINHQTKDTAGYFLRRSGGRF